jgi:hypothetical protein
MKTLQLSQMMRLLSNFGEPNDYLCIHFCENASPITVFIKVNQVAGHFCSSSMLEYMYRIVNIQLPLLPYLHGKISIQSDKTYINVTLFVCVRKMNVKQQVS